MRRVFVGFLLGGGLVVLSVACGNEGPSDSADEEATVRTGRQIYAEPHPGGNSFACAACHALSEPATDGFRRPAHSIGDALARPSYKNGQVSSFLGAVNSCLQEWMVAEPWQEDAKEFELLVDYLGQQAPEGAVEEASALHFDIVAPPAELSGGDSARGQALFNQSCAVCHGADAVGTERALALTGSLLTPEYVAERVRLSGASTSPIYEGLTGGRMPFWAADRLSDDELRDLIAFVLELEGVDLMGVGGAPSTGDGTSGIGGPLARDCPATHEKVGQSATLTAHYHNVGGTAEIVDDCTITVTDFTYDGTGIRVEVYSGQNGSFVNGFAMSGDLKRAGAYEGETLTLTIPEGKTLDDVDSLSVWCVDVAVSFGDGTFE